MARSTPPSGFGAVVGWAQAIDILGAGVPSRVEFDWLRLRAVVGGQDVVLQSDEYAQWDPEMKWFGLYRRSPWFSGDRQADMPFSINNGAIVLEPHQQRTMVFHWWNVRRAPVPAGTTRVWVEARVRITGGAGAQIGFDFWRTTTAQYAGPDVNNTEGGASDWHGDSTADWQIMSINRP